MRVGDLYINADLSTVLAELKKQLYFENIRLLEKTIETPSDIMIQCPYHKNGQERRPSAGIKKSDGTFHCLACGETHSLPEVISHCFGEDDRFGKFGWNWLIRNFLSVEAGNRSEIEIENKRANPLEKEDPEYVTEEELDKYRYIHPYMYERKLTDEIIELFDIGYDKDTKCITFPNRDPNGNCLFVARRSVQTKFFSYPKDVEKPVYGLYELAQCNIINGGRDPERNFLIICESMIDALTCWVYGKPAVALNGLGSEEQFKILSSLPIRKYILATDADERGMKARERIARSIKNHLITEYTWDLKDAKDINDMSKEMFLNLQETFI